MIRNKSKQHEFLDSLGDFGAYWRLTLEIEENWKHVGMFRYYHILWFSLPLLFATLVCWAYCKRIFDMRGRESAEDYFRETLFCLAGALASVAIDSKIPASLLRGYGFSLVSAENEWVLRILIYPAVLLLMAYTAKFIRLRKDKRKQTKRRKRRGRITRT